MNKEKTYPTDGLTLLPPTFEAWEPADPDRAVIAMMSGGVDSSVTALVLKQAGWDVVGVTMKIPMAEQCEHPSPCCGSQAAFVCRDLGIPHYFVDVTEAFQRHVIEPFRRDYAEGRTPSPCVDCNTFIKFGIVWDFLEGALGVSRLATGHYARVEQREQGAVLVRGEDVSRDQSYFMYGIPARRLKDLLLPMGDRSKDEVRALAREHGLEVANRQDSMELCFAGEGDYRNALAGGSPQSGPIVDVDGKRLGTHTGITNYTLGQRRGLGVAAAHPLYVLRIDVDRNTVIVGTREQAWSRSVRTEALNVMQPWTLESGDPLFGKIRSAGDPAPCKVVARDSENMTVEFESPVFAPAPGQHLVLYNSNSEVVAGGKICSGINN